MRLRPAAVADVPAMVQLQRAAFVEALVPILPGDFELREGAENATATLWSLRDNHAASAFYESLGFEPDGATQTRPSFGAVEVRYVRSLSAGGL